MGSAAAATYLSLIDLERSIGADVAYSLKTNHYVAEKGRGMTYATADL